jgi:glycosyltransferase involved in cell wall biosynthesis
VSSLGRLVVLHVVVPTSGGIATAVLGQVRDQIERGWRVTVACPAVGGLGYAVREAGAAVRWWRAGESCSVAGEVTRLSAVVRDVRPDVVHLHGGRAGVAGRLVVRGRAPTLLQPHGWSLLGTEGVVRRRARRSERLLDRWTTELVLASPTEALVADELGLATPAVTVPSGVDLTRFEAADERARTNARAALGLPEDPTAVCIGRLAVAKGQQDLLVDWPAVVRRVPGARLVLVGDGPDRGALERQAAETPGVSLVGARADVPAWLAAADVVVVPSRWESAARVPLESMASARSVVATDTPAAVETLPETSGELVPVGDGPRLVEAVARRLLDPALAAHEGAWGRAHVEGHHDAATVHRELARTYLRLVGAHRSQ